MEAFLKQFEENPTVSLEAVKFNVKDNTAHHETIKNISRKLEKMYEIKVDKNRTPAFDADLMDKYYEDMKNGWWQDVFCKDIYFVSADGIVYKDMLMQVPNDTRYARFLHDKFIQLDGNLLIPLNTGLRSAAIGVGCLHHIDF